MSEAKTSKRRRRWAWIVVLVMLLAFVVIPAARFVERESEAMANVQRALLITMAARVYAVDYEGQWPNSLAELEPDYLDEDSQMLVYFDPESKKGEPWRYTPPKDYPPAPDQVVLLSPSEWREKRVIGFASGAVAWMKTQ